jgi:DNA modification methylase
MGKHYFTKSQWCFPTEAEYKKLQALSPNAYKREHDELKREFYATRAYFDNTHDNMTDVWEYASVSGEERLGHATPKPLAMIERCIRSSSEENAIVIEPFLGSGTTLIAAEKTNRKCYGMEISPKYCDVIIQRWENATGQKAVLDEG